MNEPTKEELERLATEIYWDLENGQGDAAIRRLRELIEKAKEREREKSE